MKVYLAIHNDIDNDGNTYPVLAGGVFGTQGGAQGKVNELTAALHGEPGEYEVLEQEVL